MTAIREFIYKELDEEGEITLDILSDAEHLNNWMFETIRPYISEGSLLEIGSGIGNISSIFIQNGYDIAVSDLRPHYCQALEKRFTESKHLTGVYNMDLVDDEFDLNNNEIFRTFDNIFALNVIEHIKDDSQAINNIQKLLRPGGKFIMLVPAYEKIYNRFDKELYHYRRYNTRTASTLFKKNNMKVKNSFYFNAAGILGWVFFGGLLKHRTINKEEMRMYNSFVPVFKVVDRALLNKVGLSVIVVGEKEA